MSVSEPVQPLTMKPGWQALKIHYQHMKTFHLRQLFDLDPHRGERFRIEDIGLYFDYSKNLINTETLDLLLQLAETSRLRHKIVELSREVEAPASPETSAQQATMKRDDSLAYMTNLVSRVWNGEWTGYTGMRVKTVVHLDVDPGESGPLLAHKALSNFINSDITTQFITPANSKDFCSILRDLNPAETLFVVVSESFTSRETLACAHKARRWILKAMREEGAVARHFIAVSDNTAEVTKFGIEADNMFGFWNRFPGITATKGSATGISTMMAIGPDLFFRMMAGFRAMDDHFRTAPFERNIPVIAGLLGVWYSNFYGSEKIAVLPYNHLLLTLPAFLSRFTARTGGRKIIFPTQGAQGGYTDDPLQIQDDFCHRVLQSIAICPCDFIGFCRSAETSGEQHQLVMAKMLSVTQTLAFGRQEHRCTDSGESLLPAILLEGNHPSNTLLAASLTPETFGKLIALYEHSLFTEETVSEAALLDMEEIGGALRAQHILQEMEGDQATAVHDSSTSGLIRYLRNPRMELC